MNKEFVNENYKLMKEEEEKKGSGSTQQFTCV